MRSTSDRSVRLQNLRDFTVQIHRLDNDQIVGTGIPPMGEGLPAEPHAPSVGRPLGPGGRGGGPGSAG